MPTDLDHHIIRGILYPAHGLSTEVLRQKEFSETSNGVIDIVLGVYFPRLLF